VVLARQEINIDTKKYEYIIDEQRKIITLPIPSGMHAGMKRHYSFRGHFGNDYRISMINIASWQKMKQTNEIKILKVEVKK